MVTGSRPPARSNAADVNDRLYGLAVRYADRLREVCFLDTVETTFDDDVRSVDALVVVPA